MPITQKIIRISESKLQEWSGNAKFFQKLVDFEFTGPESELDLNWASEGLVKYFQLSNQPDSCIAALHALLNGKRTLDSYLGCTAERYIVYSSITILESAELTMELEIMNEIDLDALKNCLPRSIKIANSMLGTELNCHPDEFYLEYYKKLMQFSADAEKTKQSLVQWWD